MGRRNKTYSKDLHQQAYDRLTGMLAFGESKKEAMATGTAKNKIFSHATYKNYWKHIKYFLGYIKEKHPECTTLKNAKKYVNEWLQSRVDQGLSAWTVQLEAKALEQGQVTFYKNLPQDHTALASTLLSLSPLLSKRTILKQLPWVKDAEEELRRKAEETMETEE